MAKTPLSKAEILARAKDFQWKLCVDVEFSKEDLERHYKKTTSRTFVHKNEINSLVKKLQKGVVTRGYLDGRREVLFLRGNPPKYFFHVEEQHPFGYSLERR